MSISQHFWTWRRPLLPKLGCGLDYQREAQPGFQGRIRSEMETLQGTQNPKWGGYVLGQLPFGYLTVCYRKWSIYYKWILAIFHSYVEYSEGRVAFCLTSEISRWWLGSGKGLTVSGNMSVSQMITVLDVYKHRFAFKEHLPFGFKYWTYPTELQNFGASSCTCEELFDLELSYRR